jgi:hypothetical protein
MKRFSREWVVCNLTVAAVVMAVMAIRSCQQL